MRVLYCWRCKLDVPMLDKAEYAIVADRSRQAIRATQEYRQRYQLPLKDCPIDLLFRPVRDAYRALTGMDESNHTAIMHHRIARYGPPCAVCGKPLRTPQAQMCAACGSRVYRLCYDDSNRSRGREMQAVIRESGRI